MGFVLRRLLNKGYFYGLFQDVVGDANIRRYFADNYLNVTPGAKVLDIACGTGRMIPFMPKVHYVGIDNNQNYLDTARSRFAGQYSFYCHSVSNEIPLDLSEFDLVIGAGIVHHLNDEDNYRLFRLAYDALKTGGRFVTLDVCLRRKQHYIARFMAHMDRGRFVRTQDAFLELAERVFPVVDAFDYCGKLKIPVNHCVLICKKS